MEKGKIIFLNGVSSAGKTTLAKALQAKLPEPFFWIALDTFFDIVPEKYKNRDSLPILRKFTFGMRNTIKVFSDIGLNTIVDDVLEMPQEVEECVEVLHENPVLFVHVTCPLEELRRREKERGDRQIGQAEMQLPYLSPRDNTYDITIDTFANTKEECANKIIEMLNYPEKFTAFKILWEQMQNKK
ncbi:MAG: chloramphenicol phosphotransferase CPT family protein [Oscillospiraceae bacterium]|nr:chloramphenicol phosphotransferase CPT family protein [Oscillospiraceae bacterium]